MHFTRRDEIVFFFDTKPGSHATMFGPKGRKLTFRGDLCNWNNDKREYTWAFEHRGPFASGTILVFASDAHEVAGEVAEDGSIAVVDKSVTITRGAGRKPLSFVQPLPAASETRVVAVAPRPRVSVFTCSYNRPDYLRVAIESMRAQTADDWEHLIYDDASTDPDVEKVLRWAEKDPRVRVVRGEVNINRPAVLWNRMADLAVGRYFTALDDDNEKFPRFIEIMAGKLDADPDLAVVTCAWLLQPRDSEPERECFMNAATGPAALADRSTCDGGAMLYRREVFERVGGFTESLRTNEDWDLLRRMVHNSKHVNLEDVLCTYRSHDGNRMLVAESLGNREAVNFVRGRLLDQVLAPIGVTVTVPPETRLTQSQRDATRAILGGINGHKISSDFAVVLAPFQLSTAEAAAAVSGSSKAVSVHMEDPYALHANLERVRAMAAACGEVWVATNDLAAKPFYNEVVGERVIVCPSLGADARIAVTPAKRDIDILLCGYAYPSRKRFVAELLPLLDCQPLLVGDGWGSLGTSTKDLDTTYRLHARAKTVVCLHRTSGDCADGPVEPATVNRGFLEGYCGARVFIDRMREHHSFDPDDVVWYDNSSDLAGKLRAYLANPRQDLADRFADKCRTIYTARARIERIINAVKTARYNAVIP